MAVEVLGISGSPFPNGTLDLAVLEILNHCGLDYELVRLSSFHIEPCRRCEACRSSHQCQIHDNGRLLAEQLADSHGFVLGGTITYGSLDSRTKTFMERMYCLSHAPSRLRDKPAVTVLAVGQKQASAGELAQRQVDLWLEQERIACVGRLLIADDLAQRPDAHLAPAVLEQVEHLGHLLRDAIQARAAQV